jgi:hypothetical protein
MVYQHNRREIKCVSCYFDKKKYTEKVVFIEKFIFLRLGKMNCSFTPCTEKFEFKLPDNLK